MFLLLNRNKAGKTVDGLYDVPRRDKLAVKTSVSGLKEDSSSDEDPGAIYAVPRPTSLPDRPDDTMNVELRVDSPERNGILPNKATAKGRNASSHLLNSHAEKQPPVAPRKKPENDHTIAPPVKRGENLIK